MRSVSDLVRQAAKSSPDAVAIVDGATRLTWRELDARASAAASALRGRGMADGDRVALVLPTGIDFVVLYLAACRAGLVCVPINPAYTEAERAYVVADSGAGLVLGEREAAAFLTDASVEAADPDRDRTGEDLAVLLYTSGTSGRPKGAMLSTRALLANLEQLAAVDPPLATPTDVVFVPLPLFHVFGLNAGLGFALFKGCTAVLAGAFDPAASLALMADERVTVVCGVPPMFAAWAAHPEFRRGFATVDLAFSGAAPLPPALVAAYGRVGVSLHEGYGLTETAPVLTSNAIGAGRGNPKAGSVGKPLPGIEVELRDADGEVVGEDQDPGQVYVRGANLFSGYWPSGEGGPDDDGWWATGDIGVLDEDGDLSLVGRTSDMVLVNGFNVYPAEVESVLATAPGVEGVAVVGVADEASGEHVRAYVIPKPGVALAAEDVLAHAAKSLARFKLPKEIEIVASLPRTVTGKVMKWKLSDGAE